MSRSSPVSDALNRHQNISLFSRFGLSGQAFSVPPPVHTVRMESWSDATVSLDEQIDSWQEELLAVEAQIGRLRFRQVQLIRRLDRFQVDTAQGARTMGDWTSAQLDVSSQTAGRLTQIAHHQDSEIDQAMAEGGRWGLDRAAALAKLRTAGIDPDLFCEVAENYSLGRLYGLLDRLRHVDPVTESEIFDSRYLVIQPNLDESVYLNVL